MSSLTPVQEFYRDKTVFITGGSGFMGKVLIEKLLYSCSEVKEILLLMRPKRGKAPETRLEEMYKLPLFQRIREEKPQVFKKLTIVSGDVTTDGLGLSEEDTKQVTEKTNIVFHMAATLKLEGNLQDAIEMNTTGTKRALDLAKQMKGLVAFIHLSTAFCNCDQEVMYEKVYEFNHKPEDLMRLVQWMDLKSIEAITPELLTPHPNTYTYSKRLAEILVRDHYEQNMPVVITRPSIVLPSAFEPVPGWVDNLNGPTGLMVGAGKGVIRSMLIDTRHKSEAIPVDYAINGLITIAFEFATSHVRPASVPVYNITCSEHRKMPWGTVIEMSKRVGYQYPVEAGLWYPDGCITTNRLHHRINVILFHWLPAILIDFILLLLGQKRFMIRVQNKVSQGLEVLQFFSMTAWKFNSENFAMIWDNLSKPDKAIAYEPLPGWVDNMNGPTGLMIGASKGVIRSVLLEKEYMAELIPVDYAINGLITIAYEFATAEKRPETVPVYNITNAECRKSNWGYIIDTSKTIGREYPLDVGLWYADPCITNNRLYHKFNVLFFHWLPAILIDFLLLILGQKRFMIRVQNKISTGLQVLEFFTMTKWTFNSLKYDAVWHNLTPKDKKEFNMDMNTEDTEEMYMICCAKGARQYILKESLEDIPKARVHQNLMWALDRFCKLVIVGSFFYWLASKVGLLQ